MRADAADLAQIRERVRLRLRIAMSHDEREGEDGGIVLGRTTGIADFNDPVHSANAVRLDATNDCVVLHGRSLRVGEAEQVCVRPTVTLLILHGLVREVIGTAIHLPVADSVAETATPAAHRVHIFREVE